MFRLGDKVIVRDTGKKYINRKEEVYTYGV